MGVRLAVVGATGAVGSLVVKLLQERRFPMSAIKFLASANSVGKSIDFNGEPHYVQLLEPDAFRDIDLVIASTPDDVAAVFVPWAVDRGATVIDESGYHRMMDHVPLVIPEVNPHALEHHQGIIASPNCSTTQLVVCLKPLHDAYRVRRVVVATYQAASGVGVSGTRDLNDGTQAYLAGSDWHYQAFAHPLAFNLIPQIGSPRQQGYTSEELKMVHETHKILEDSAIEVCPTCVRVPVANCHSESIWVELERPATAEQARALFAQSPGIEVHDDLDAKLYPMPSTCDDRDEVFVGRIRGDLYRDNALSFWCVSDNLRKGAATNAVQIAETLTANNRVPCGS